MLPRYRWRCIVRRPDLSYVGFAPHTRLEIRERDLAKGTWLVEMPWSGEVPNFDSGGDPQWESGAGFLLQPGAGLVMEVNNTIIASGPVTEQARIKGEDGTYTLQVSGANDLQWLEDAWADPEPGNAVPPYAAETHDRRAGPAETVIKEYVDVNVGPGAIGARQIAGFTLAADAARGLTVEQQQARFPNLLEFVADIAAIGDLGLRCIQVSQDTIEFDVYETEVKPEIKFATTLRNLGAYTLTNKRPTVTYSMAAGGGEGTARVFVADSVVSGWTSGRIERFIDQRQTVDPAELAEAAAEALADGSELFSINAAVIDTASHQWAPVAIDPGAATYNVGDTVTAVIDGIEIPQRIREMQVTDVAGEGTRLVPIIGTRGEVEEEREAIAERAIVALRKRLDYLERGV